MAIMPPTGVPGRADALAPPQGGPGRPAPSYLEMRQPQPRATTLTAPVLGGTPAEAGADTMFRPMTANVAGPARGAVPQRSASPMPVSPSTGQPVPNTLTPPPNPAQAQPGPHTQPGLPAQLPQLGGNPLVPEGQGAVPLDALGGLIERQLANPSRFDLPQVQQAYQWLGQNLADQARTAQQGAITNAASRGVYYGTPLTTSLGDIGTQFERGMGDLAGQLLLAQATTGGQDLQAAINNAFRFGENQLSADQFGAQFGLNALGMGLQGGPSVAGVLPQFGGLSSPQLQQPGGNNGLYALLAQYLTQQGGSAQPPAGG